MQTAQLFAGDTVSIAIQLDAISRVAAAKRRNACRPGSGAISKVSHLIAKQLNCTPSSRRRWRISAPAAMAMIAAPFAVVVTTLRVQAARVRKGNLAEQCADPGEHK